MRWIMTLQFAVLTVAAVAAGLIHAHYSEDRGKIAELVPGWHESAAIAANERLLADAGGAAVASPVNDTGPTTDIDDGVRGGIEEPVAGMTMAAIEGQKRIRLDAAKFLWDTGEVIFIDARAYEFYKEGHIAEAIAIPWEVMRNGDPLPHMENGTIFAGETRLVVYCKGGDCDESDMVALELRSMGFTCHVFIDGYPGWVEAGYEIAEGGDPWLIAFDAEPESDQDH